MSSAVCQGLQSCLEPRFVEPRMLGLKMVATKPNSLRPNTWERRPPRSINSDSYFDEGNIESNSTTTNTNINTTNDNVCEHKSNDSDNDKRKKKDITKLSSGGDLGGWSFVQALTTTNNNNNNSSSSHVMSKEVKEVYVHPLNKQSSIKLSHKSLEYCTENLGCETGSTTSEDIDFSSLSSPSSPSCSSWSLSDSESFKSPTRERERMSRLRDPWHKMKDNSTSFPPPLTSISGSNRVNIRPLREGGRLVMKASVVPSCHAYFQAERSDGRLILRFQQNSSSSFDSKSAAKEYEQEEEEQEEVVEADQDCVGEEENDGINCNVGGGMGMRKFQRPSRCMEGGKNKGLLIWEPPHLVATS